MIRKHQWQQCLLLLALAIGMCPDQPRAADAASEWSKIVEAAKKEGKVVVGGPPTNVLRQKFKDTFEKRFGIELEILSAPGSCKTHRGPSPNSRRVLSTSMCCTAAPARSNR